LKLQSELRFTEQAVPYVIYIFVALHNLSVEISVCDAVAAQISIIRAFLHPQDDDLIIASTETKSFLTATLPEAAQNDACHV